MFAFVRGNPERPTGNLLIYSYTRGSLFQERGSIVVCNVFVSFLASEENGFPAVIFSPTFLEREEDLENLVDLSPSCDLLRLEDLELPEGKSVESYMRSRIRKFNYVIMEYVEMCRNYLEDRMKKNISPKFRLDRGGEPLFDSKKGGEITSEELFYLDQMEACLRKQQVASESVRFRFRQLVQIVKSKYQHYDVDNFARVAGLHSEEQPLEHSDLRLAFLYLRKFRAIYDERYEDAATLQSRIEVLEVRT